MLSHTGSSVPPTSPAMPLRVHLFTGDDATALNFEAQADGPAFTASLNAGARAILAGAIETTSTRGEQALAPEGSWKPVRDETSELAQYCELEQRLSHGWTLNRQCLLLPEDKLFYLADALLGPASAAGERTPLHHSWNWTLAPNVRWNPAVETFDGKLEHRRAAAQLFPLGLPEWRSAPPLGNLREGGEHRLCLEGRGYGRALYAPLVFDLSPPRFRRPITWRALTVGEQLRAVPHDVAAGYRIQCGREQWLVYRCFGPRGNRTLLGHNLVGEFLFARFSPQGAVKPLIEIDG